jgi:hypothetical protein
VSVGASSSQFAPPAERELFVRHARKDGRSVAVLRAVERGGAYVVEAQLFPEGGAAAAPSLYVFSDGREATAFVTEAVEALLYLGCEVRAD